ncbi:MAG: histidine kinase [Desulfobulbaceae bacterium A2]|nr:MAG: histidine kinase [Desulfobulbaceae bacterium A2]
MRLKSTFIIAIGAILALSYGLLLHRASSLQHELVIGQALQQARMLHKQILMTRQWVADHQGLFVIRSENVQPNPFLDSPLIQTVEGEVFVKRNPAMVTRELSEYAAREGFCWFRVTSLKPVNPANQPDAFEREGLLRFQESSLQELSRIEEGDNGRLLRFIAPLRVETSCLECHARHGYQAGDIRGALSISIPISWADQVIGNNNRAIMIYGAVSVLLVAGALVLLFNTLVLRRLDQLSRAMEQYPATLGAHLPLPQGQDELGSLAGKFQDLCCRLDTSQLQLDQARTHAFHSEKMAALGQLTAGIAHEINNPLGGLLNCVKTMREDPDNLGLHHRYLPLLDKGLRRIEHTMRQLLNFGRSEPLRLYKTDVDAVIRECCDLLEYRLKQIDLRLDLAIGQPHCIDVEALKQVVFNIALNGIQAMPQGGVLTIATREVDGCLELLFQDNGCGIPQDIRHKIFDPFFTTKEVGEGTGLGLAVTYALVQRMHGTIEVDSDPGRGSRFIVLLPAEQNCPVAPPRSEPCLQGTTGDEQSSAQVAS